MTSSEKFCLKWEDFQHNIVSSFNDLREDSDFSDVTLVCDEDHQINAHKIILTACSTFFKTVLRKNKNSHPIIYMRGLKAKDLVALVDFIYHGETNIFQDDLDAFLALAEDLQLKGLTGSLSNPDLDIENLSTKHQINRKTDKYVQKQDNKQFQQFHPSLYGSPIDENKTRTPVVSAEVGNIVVPFDDSMVNHDIKLEAMMERNTDGDNMWKCTLCGKKTNKRSDMVRHIETHMDGLSYPCNQCGKISRSKMSLQSHMSRYHRK